MPWSVALSSPRPLRTLAGLAPRPPKPWSTDTTPAIWTIDFWLNEGGTVGSWDAQMHDLQRRWSADGGRPAQFTTNFDTNDGYMTVSVRHRRPAVA